MRVRDFRKMYVTTFADKVVWVMVLSVKYLWDAEQMQNVIDFGQMDSRLTILPLYLFIVELIELYKKRWYNNKRMCYF